MEAARCGRPVFMARSSLGCKAREEAWRHGALGDGGADFGSMMTRGGRGLLLTRGLGLAERERGEGNARIRPMRWETRCRAVGLACEEKGDGLCDWASRPKIREREGDESFNFFKTIFKSIFKLGLK